MKDCSFCGGRGEVYVRKRDKVLHTIKTTREACLHCDQTGVDQSGAAFYDEDVREEKERQQEEYLQGLRESGL